MSSDTKGSRKPDRPIYQPGVLLAYTSNLFYNTLLVIVEQCRLCSFWFARIKYCVILIAAVRNYQNLLCVNS